LYKVDQENLESFETWCWRRMEISWTDRVRNEQVLHRVKEERSILQTIKSRKDNSIGHILRRNCLLNHVTEGKIEVTGRICKQLPDELNKREDTVNRKR
jgi:hypothetical protein